MNYAYELLNFVNKIRDLLINFGVNAWTFFNDTINIGNSSITYLELLIGPGLFIILSLLVIKFIT